MGQGLLVVEHRAEIAQERKVAEVSWVRQNRKLYRICYYLSIFIEWWWWWRW
jgi:hypothetical protein